MQVQLLTDTDGFISRECPACLSRFMYLATEVNYALQQKREKGNRFAIVMLRLPDANGNRGEIPELLRIYVWAEPENELDALRRILRAFTFAARFRGLEGRRSC